MRSVSWLMSRWTSIVWLSCHPLTVRGVSRHHLRPGADAVRVESRLDGAPVLAPRSPPLMRMPLPVTTPIRRVASDLRKSLFLVTRTSSIAAGSLMTRAGKGPMRIGTTPPTRSRSRDEAQRILAVGREVAEERHRPGQCRRVSCGAWSLNHGRQFATSGGDRALVPSHDARHNDPSVSSSKMEEGGREGGGGRGERRGGEGRVVERRKKGGGGIVTRISQGGQVQIPAEIRRRWGTKDVVIDDGGTLIRFVHFRMILSPPRRVLWRALVDRRATKSDVSCAKRTSRRKIRSGRGTTAVTVLDASALTAFLLDEPAREQVTELLRRRPPPTVSGSTWKRSSISWCASMDAAEEVNDALDLFLVAGLEVQPFWLPNSRRAAAVRADPLRQTDCCALAGRLRLLGNRDRAPDGSSHQRCGACGSCTQRRCQRYPVTHSMGVAP